MNRIAQLLLAAGAVAAVTAPVTLGATRPTTARAIAPIPGKAKGCKQHAPTLLGSGRAPHAPLRIELARMASVRRGQADIEHVKTTLRRADHKGKPLRTNGTIKVVSVLSTHTLRANGTLPVAVHGAITYPGAAHPKPAHNTFGLNGYIDALDGGALGTTLKGAGGTPVDDHFPTQPVGVGATWRVVNCDRIDLTPAKETRVYALRSVANGVIRMSFRDDIELDPAQTKLASQKVNGAKITVRLTSLHGTAKGTLSIPVANGLAERRRTVSYFTARTETDTGTAAGTVVQSTVVDTETQLPTR